jgi:hypothetical protein
MVLKEIVYRDVSEERAGQGIALRLETNRLWHPKHNILIGPKRPNAPK